MCNGIYLGLHAPLHQQAISNIYASSFRESVSIVRMFPLHEVTRLFVFQTT